MSFNCIAVRILDRKGRKSLKILTESVQGNTEDINIEAKTTSRLVS
jgi:hypothetical protein